MLRTASIIAIVVAAGALLVAQQPPDYIHRIGSIELSVNAEKTKAFATIDVDPADGFPDRGFIVEFAAGVVPPAPFRLHGTVEWRELASLLLTFDAGADAGRRILFDAKSQPSPVAKGLGKRDQRFDIVALDHGGFTDARPHARLAERILQRKVKGRIVPR